MNAKSLFQAALHLTPIERLHLVEYLVKSLDNPDKKIEAVWEEESEKRYQALVKGKVKTMSLNEVKKRFK
jgi:putative addiction module component (TIGR02574 family)